jgi:Leucine-rich repeat (LRR) protein
MKEFRINKFLSLRLEYPNTVIYVGDKKFRTCKYLLLDINIEKTELEDIESMDEIIEIYSKDTRNENPILNPDTEFWGHCSNIQAWAENDYNTRFLDMKLAFPLLKKLSDVGDPTAKKVLKEEIAKRLQENAPSVRQYLIEEGYVNSLSGDELNAIGIDWVEYEEEKIPIVENNIYLQKKGIRALTEIKGLFTSPKPKKLALYSNNLTTLPGYIGKLKTLNILRVDDNYLKELPESIGNLTSLKSLWIQYNKLKTLPEPIGNLHSLEVLKCQRNNISKLPDSLGNLKSLKQLWLRSNHLRTLPKSIGNLEALNKLILGDNDLRTLPKSIGDLKSLKRLDLQRNKLRNLPESIGNLQSLKELSLYNNQLTHLPNSIGNLKSLEHLYLNQNKIRVIPKSIGNLRSLKKLIISGNKLKRLPNALLKLPNLTHLNIEDNDLDPSTVSKVKRLKDQGVKINEFDLWDF